MSARNEERRPPADGSAPQSNQLASHLDTEQSTAPPRQLSLIEARSDHTVQPSDHVVQRWWTAPTKGTARKADPETSRQAAQSMHGDHLADRQQEVLDALVRLGGRGTLDDVVAITGRERGSTSRRLTDLSQAGVIRRTWETRPGRSGRPQTVWAVISQEVTR